MVNKFNISREWLRLFSLIPNYDPIIFAKDTDAWDEQAADRAISFFPKCLKHVKGTKAGEPFILEDWEKAIIGCLFGWKRADNLRRYRECLIYVAKKNGKSALVAGVILYMLVCDDEQGAEIYSAAASKEQAALIFSHAAGMVRQEKLLKERLTVYGERGGGVNRSIVYDDVMSFYRCLAADANTADGANVHMAAIDELHRHRSPELADILQKSTAARKQPLVIYTTTADYNRESLCNTKHKYARQVCENGGDPSKPGYDPEFLPVIFEATKDDEFTSEDVWAKANPNLGVTIPVDFLRRECHKAQESPSELNNFLRLHLNIVTDSDVAWLDIDEWDACGSEFDPHSLEGRECYAGLDLSTTIDITALVLIYPEFTNDNMTENYEVLSYFWVPADNARGRQQKDRVPYETWIRAGYIDATPGNVVDYEAVRQKLLSLRDIYNIREIAIDRWNSTQLQTQLTGDDFNVVQFGQGYASMSAPTKELEKLIVSRRINHGNNPVLRWMAGNTMIEQDAAGNIKPSKKKSTEKIDGIVALAMALGRALVSENAESVYENRGIVYV